MIKLATIFCLLDKCKVQQKKNLFMETGGINRYSKGPMNFYGSRNCNCGSPATWPGSLVSQSVAGGLWHCESHIAQIGAIQCVFFVIIVGCVEMQCCLVMTAHPVKEHTSCTPRFTMVMPIQDHNFDRTRYPIFSEYKLGIIMLSSNASVHLAY